MENFSISDTIASISTPIGKGGIGIVKISGDEAIDIADKIFLSKDKRKVKDFESFTIHYGWIVDRQQTSDIRLQTLDFSPKLKPSLICSNKQQPITSNQIIDEVLLSVMKAPKTYTTENMVEINCHSGIVILKQILNLVLDNGARLAKPGEFTQRAFVNGRIDLVQAEAVLDVVESKTKGASKLAVQQLEGELSTAVNDFKKKLLEIYVQLEAAINFPEESETSIDFKNFKQKIFNISDEIKEIIKNAEKGQLIREGRSLVICGKPNVGKSCLMNALLRKDRVIVTPIPGTTRDIIEESINIKGIPFRIIDTAGLISSNDIVEKEGVKRSEKHLESSDIVILVLDSSQKLNKKDKELIEIVKNKPHILVLNKIDLKTVTGVKDIQKKNDISEGKIIKISALKSKGIKNLEEVIIDTVWKGELNDRENVLVTNQRHKHVLEQAYNELDRIRELPDNIDSVELMSVDVKSAIDSLGKMTGETFTEDLLNEIFSQFCIGK